MKLMSIFTILFILELTAQTDAKYHIISIDSTPNITYKERFTADWLEDCAWLCENSECCRMFSYNLISKVCSLFDQFTAVHTQHDGTKTYKSFKKFNNYQRRSINWFITAGSQDVCENICAELPTCEDVLRTQHQNTSMTCYLRPKTTFLKNLKLQECEKACLSPKNERCKSFLHNPNSSLCWLYMQEFGEKFLDFDDQFSYFERSCKGDSTSNTDPVTSGSAGIAGIDGVMFVSAGIVTGVDGVMSGNAGIDTGISGSAGIDSGISGKAESDPGNSV